MKHDMLGLKELIRFNIRTYSEKTAIKDLKELRNAFLQATDMVFDDLEEERALFGSTDKAKPTLEEKRKTTPKAYEKWTPEEEAELKRLYQDEIKVAEIAKQLGRNYGGVRARLKKLGLME